MRGCEATEWQQLQTNHSADKSCYCRLNGHKNLTSPLASKMIDTVAVPLALPPVAPLAAPPTRFTFVEGIGEGFSASKDSLSMPRVGNLKEETSASSAAPAASEPTRLTSSGGGSPPQLHTAQPPFSAQAPPGTSRSGCRDTADCARSARHDLCSGHGRRALAQL